MYRTCIFCSKDLGGNEVIEQFPVGSRLAFDARKGRLWAICPRCARWNLAPIEERWEAVEEAERSFRDARMRVQSENIGMAKMPDGTRLIRIGAALPGELAAWRYGNQLVKRRTNTYLSIGALVVGGGVVMAGFPLVAGVGVPVTMLNPIIQLTSLVVRRRAEERVVLQLPALHSPTGEDLTLRRRHLRHAKLTSIDGTLGVSVPVPTAATERSLWRQIRAEQQPYDGPRILLHDDAAQKLAARAMVDYNSAGASKQNVADALQRLTNAGSAQAFIEQIAKSEPVLRSTAQRGFRRTGGPDPAGNLAHVLSAPRRVLGTFRGERLDVARLGRHPAREPLIARPDALAFEMALHDESERRAMEGELEDLEDAWREAENIARIADALPDEPPE